MQTAVIPRFSNIYRIIYRYIIFKRIVPIKYKDSVYFLSIKFFRRLIIWMIHRLYFYLNLKKLTFEHFTYFFQLVYVFEKKKVLQLLLNYLI